MTMGSVSFAFSGEPAVHHPVPFRWHAGWAPAFKQEE